MVESNVCHFFAWHGPGSGIMRSLRVRGQGWPWTARTLKGSLGSVAISWGCFCFGPPFQFFFSIQLSHPELGEAVRSTSYIGNLGAGGAPGPFPHSIVLGVGVTPVRKLGSSAERTTNLKNTQTNKSMNSGVEEGPHRDERVEESQQCCPMRSGETPSTLEKAQVCLTVTLVRWQLSEAMTNSDYSHLP